LARILKQLGLSGGRERDDKMLTWDQIRRMGANGIEFGGHTVTHPFLSRMTRDQATWEVSECKRRIESELHEPVNYFAYPNGREEDFCNWSKELLHHAGYHAAVSTLWGMNYRTTDRMELRRGGPWEESPELFASKLDWYQLVNA
jgi:peptidoglycan/xylan/chitin deacetylase (PgdA/CDA1 family)